MESRPDGGMGNSSVSQSPDVKRVDKALYAGLFLATAASLGLIVIQPQAPTSHDHLLIHHLLFDVYTAFILLILIMGIGLIIHSIHVPLPDAASTWIQKCVMMIGLGFMVAAFVLRISIVLTTDSSSSSDSSSSYVGLLFFSPLLVWYGWQFRTCGDWGVLPVSDPM